MALYMRDMSAEMIFSLNNSVNPLGRYRIWTCDFFLVREERLNTRGYQRFSKLYDTNRFKLLKVIREYQTLPLVWIHLWVKCGSLCKSKTPHISLCYGDELPKSFDLGELNELIPITLTFDTISVYKTGPLVSEWKEITTLLLDWFQNNKYILDF